VANATVSPWTNRARVRTVAACGLGSFTAALSTNLVNISAPAMAKDLALTTGQISRILTVYLLAITVLLPVFGRLGDTAGCKKVFVVGFAGFGVFALACAHASGIASLIVARCFQGAAAAMLMATAAPIVLRAFPPTHRARVLGMLLSLTYVGLVLGPMLGGIIVGALGWRAIFVLLAAISVLGTLLAALWLERDSGAAPGQKRARPPLIPVALLRVPPFAFGIAGALLLYTTTFMLSFSLPFELQHTRGMSARAAGLLMTSQPVVMAVIAPFGGWLADRFGTRAPCAFAMFILACAYLLLPHAVDGSNQGIVLVLGLVGLGAGTFIAPNNASIMGAAPKEQQATAAAAAMARNIGMTCGVALAASLFQRTGEFRMVMLGAAVLAIVGATVALFRKSAIPMAA